ncbi:amidohydrolase [Winogradskyella aquimaris]|uniref:Amidohydrolase family protein n=1 Tax=Winogradskyella aquimaris TaxID=864074 RepID=A0ABU5EJS8_9FLAO|nr:amidohydrolase family protein [Winogradskyella aquimaris]MDY2585723.1 amidohydrolase family protein [Winogradskyella aquimaris]
MTLYNSIRTLSILLLVLIFYSSCSDTPKESATMLIYGGTIYTVDSTKTKVEAIAVKHDRILYAGNLAEAEKFKTDQTELLDLKGKTMTPGFIEGHGHFMGLGYNELNLDLMNTTSYQAIVDAVAERVKTAKPGEWITGRGWHQSKWDSMPAEIVHGFQTHHLLSEVSPDNPVYLRHASGHAGFANAKAMEIAGLTEMALDGSKTYEVEGGEVLVDALGRPTGIFNERAQTLITQHIPQKTPETDRKAFELAVKACHKNGITSFHDAGIPKETIALYEQMKAEGKMGVRIYAMLTGWDEELLNQWYKKGIMVDDDHLFTIRSIKLNCDGALGSRGAWLLEPYTDRPDHFGHETLPMEFVKKTAINGLKHGFQVCSHAIGDRANREILDRYEIAFNSMPNKTNNHRFRIEHAQHLHPEDIPRFAELNVIPAMQAVHMSSDRPWAIDRLGEKRIKEGAYMWQSLLQSGVPIVNGTDVPVEPINPIASFYSSVSRKTLKGTPEGGYEPEQKMTRTQALKSYTLDAAYGAFEEDIKGSISVGKLADFTVFDQDIINIPENQLLDTKVVMTILNGEVVFNAEK